MLMYCPRCRAEYEEGFARCLKCGGALRLYSPDTTRTTESLTEDMLHSAVVVWQGNDPLLADRILELLVEEGTEVHCDRVLTLQMPVPAGRDCYGIWVHRRDEARARELIREFLEAVQEEEKEESAPSRESEEGL